MTACDMRIMDWNSAVGSSYLKAVRHFTDGFISACPNAREDAVLQRFFEQPQHHEEWRKLDPNDPDALASLASPLGVPTGSSIPSVVLRVLHGSELVGVERFDLYDQAWAIRTIDDRLSARLGRGPSAWELTSAVVETAKSDGTSAPGRLLRAYATIEDAAQEESLSPEIGRGHV